MAIQIQFRRGDSADWTSVNPILAEGEVGVELDTLKLKVGNGVDDWTTLPYFGSAGTVTSVGMTVPTGLQVSGSPITTTGTLAVTLQSGYSIPTTSSQSNWDTAYSWGNHATAGYLDNADIGVSVQAYNVNTVIDASYVHTDNNYTTTEKTKLAGIEDGADVTDATNVAAAGAVMDGDFTSNGLMKRTGAGTYTVVTDNSSNWDTAYSWGNHASAGYLLPADIGVSVQGYDGDLSAIAALSGTSGLLKKTAANTWTLDTSTYLTTETDPVYTASSWYSTTNNSSDWDTAYTDRLKWDGGATGLNAATGRTSLGLGSISTQDSNNVSITGGSITGITDLAVADGGTGASTAQNARINLLPSYTGNGGKVLAVNTGATDVEWVAAGSGSGTVTSVDVSGGTTGLTTSGGPITTSGTITLAGTLAIANGGTGQTTAANAINALLPSQTGNSGKYLTTNGSVASWATVSGGGGISSADIQEFTSTGTSTWTKPTGAKMVHVLIFSGGGGGGSGRRRGAANITTALAGGGAGGGSGGRLEVWIPAASLGSTETITVGAGGTGGAAQTADLTNGNNGNDGSDSSFGSWVVCRGGAGGAGGTGTNAAGGVGGRGVDSFTSSGSAYLASGGTGTTSSGNTGNDGGFRAGGGAGGSGFNTNNTLAKGGAAGGGGGMALTNTTTTTGNGGAAGSVSSVNGGNGANSTNYFVGGAGGGSGYVSSTVAGSGGNGGYPAAGGGGGGGASGSFDSGAGGNGANGYVRVTTYF